MLVFMYVIKHECLANDWWTPGNWTLHILNTSAPSGEQRPILHSGSLGFTPYTVLCWSLSHCSPSPVPVTDYPRYFWAVRIVQARGFPDNYHSMKAPILIYHQSLAQQARLRPKYQGPQSHFTPVTNHWPPSAWTGIVQSLEWLIRGLKTGAGRSLFTAASKRLWKPLSLLSAAHWGPLFPVMKRTEREVDHSVCYRDRESMDHHLHLYVRTPSQGQRHRFAFMWPTIAVRFRDTVCSKAVVIWDSVYFPSLPLWTMTFWIQMRFRASNNTDNVW
jgi:hypothetical protein